ncbi:MAG: class I SAM-dependent methyltransferase [Alphaproteobacteria bacterium]|nr:class I SAM-dependent methyltransferase [Alphaproteobacteria bacterium]
MHTPSKADISASYDVYYGSGLYASRYPRPNAWVLNLVEDLLGEGSPMVLDFGCGEGRYAAPLLERSAARLIGYDISPTAIAHLAARCEPFVREGRLLAIDGDLDACLAACAARGPVDVALLLFGVLTHIRGRAERIETLARLRQAMKPDGRLVLTVGNRARRFHAEQTMLAGEVAAGGLEPGDVLYGREQDGKIIELFIHLYDPAEFRRDLEEAGFRVLRMTAESVLPERAVTNWGAMAVLDDVLRAVLPLHGAYDFLAVCAPAA